MAWVRVKRAFDWIGPSRHCVVCKWATWAFMPSGRAVEAPEEAVQALEAAGAGERVPEPGTAPTPRRSRRK